MNATQQWRPYNKRVPGGLALLCSISGSGCPRALPFGIVAGVGCAMLELYAGIDGFKLFEHTYPFHLIAFITGFGLIFRLNIAYQRYWEARSLTQSMAAKWADAALQVIAFDEASEGEAAASSPAFVAYAVHMFSLLHATALQSLRGDSVDGAFLPVPLPPLEPPPLRGNSSSSAVETPLVVEVLQQVSAGSSSSEHLHQRGGSGGAGCSCGRLLPHRTVYPKLEVLGGLSEDEMRCLRDSPERCHLVYTWLLKELVLRRQLTLTLTPTLPLTLTLTLTLARCSVARREAWPQTGLSSRASTRCSAVAGSPYPNPNPDPNPNPLPARCLATACSITLARASWRTRPSPSHTRSSTQAIDRRIDR